jgi:hypothetical protein
MAEGIRDWDTDWFDKFKNIFPTNFTTMALYPGNPLYWINKVSIPFGNKQAQRAFRQPNQRVNISKDIEFIDKYAKQVEQVADMPALTDSLRVDHEYYAGDTVNAIGHVGDLTENFLAAVLDFAVIGTAVSPLAYGLIDQGAGTGSTTVARPDACDAVTTAGKWDVATSIPEDIGMLAYGLNIKGFTGQKIICTHPIVEPFMDLVFTNTAAPVMNWIKTYKGYPVLFHPSFDADATTSAADVHMIDITAFDLFQTPLRMNAFYDNNQEDYVWHWSNRAYLLPRVKHDGTDYEKGIIKVAVDCTT